MIWLEKFVLPDAEREWQIARKRREENGGAFGYLENGYPCGLFPERGLGELDFEPITLLYGGNGSGKSTLLNLIAEKLRLKRQAPYNGGELFLPFAEACGVRFGLDDEGEPLPLPEESRIVSSDDVFEYMLAASREMSRSKRISSRGKKIMRRSNSAKRCLSAG